MMGQDETPAGFDDQDGGDGVVRARFEWSSTTPSTAVIETVAAATGRDPMTIESLYERVDPDALDALVSPSGSASGNGNVTVSFSFADRSVTVHRNGEVVVRPNGSHE